VIRSPSFSTGIDRALSPEARLAVRCVRDSVGDASGQRRHAEASHAEASQAGKAVAEEVDGEALAAYCRYHGIAPSVHRVLRRQACKAEACKAGGAAPRLARAVAPAARAGAGAGLLQARQLAEILKRFDRAGIRVIPLKGTSLDVRCYGGPGRRKDGDHDLLVRPHRLGDAAAALRDLGYRFEGGPCEEPDCWPDARPHHNHGPAMTRPPDARGEAARPSVVELHWALARPHAGSRAVERLTEAAWARAEPQSLVGAPAERLAPTDELVYLCLHAARHLRCYGRGTYLRLAMVEDIARQAQTYRGSIDPDRARGRMQAASRLSALGAARFLCREVLGVEPRPLRVAARPWPRSAPGRALLPLRTLLGDLEAVHSAGDAPPNYARRLRRILVHGLLLPPSARAAFARRWLTRANERDWAATPFVRDEKEGATARSCESPKSGASAQKPLARAAALCARCIRLAGNVARDQLRCLARSVRRSLR
jgi:hypothetical protein